MLTINHSTIYPFEKDWQKLASITGDNTWSADSMRKYFERFERNQYLPGGSDGHGYQGWLSTSLTNLELVLTDPKLLTVIVSAATGAGSGLLGKVIDTVTGLGGILLRDLNSNASDRDQRTGAYQVPIAVDTPDYKRSGPRQFILDTARAVNSDGSRKYHLDLQLNTLVTNVRFDTSGNKPKATGVDYLRGQSLYRADPRSGNATASSSGSVQARREIIIATGTFNTPQLLKLSGVGPKQELNKWGINTLVDLPGLGKNLQDRYETTVVGQTPTNFALTDKCTFGYKEPDPCLEQWKNEKSNKGTYTTNGIAIAAIRNSSTSDGDPDLLVTGAPVDFTGYYPGFAYEGLKESNHWAWITLKARARNNAGTVELRSKDPRDTPVIHFNSFDTGVTQDGADDKDLQAVLEGMKYSRDVFDAVVPLAHGFTEVWPGRNVATDDELKEFIKKEAWGHHACCTAPIGADDDPDAVLDSNFKVRGTDGLRVVDASVFPKIPGWYIAVPIYMISEKAAEVIIADAA